MPEPTQTIASAVTMVRDDLTFLKIWLGYYGAEFGRRNLTVVNHGNNPEVRALADGCNLIALPDSTHPNFDTKRWRLLNGIVSGLLGYYRFVLVGDVDEIVVSDPGRGQTLLERLSRIRRKKVLTPFGLEVVHRCNEEKGDIHPHVLGARRHVRIAPRYAKPCVVGAQTRIARGGHYASRDRLAMPHDMYLLHLRYCDRTLFRKTMDRRNELVERTGADRPETAMIGRHWFPEKRNDADQFSRFQDAPVISEFDVSEARREMRDGWQKRPDSEYWQPGQPEQESLYRLPDRFIGLV